MEVKFAGSSTAMAALAADGDGDIGAGENAAADLLNLALSRQQAPSVNCCNDHIGRTVRHALLASAFIAATLADTLSPH